MFSKLKSRKSRTKATESVALYYASDVHGSEQCWRKFLGAGRFYGVGALIMGGDLTGKAIVPIAQESGDVHRATFLGEQHVATGTAELEELLKAIRYNGMYPWVATAPEIAAHAADAAARDVLFERVMLTELSRWIELADERMSEYGIDVFVMAGNDDPWDCDEVIAAAGHVTLCDDRVVHVGAHEMISLSYANPTPWRSPRELDEDALYERIKRLADQLEDPASSIFNLHVPPHDSGLDRAREIRDDLTVVYKSGGAVEIPVGSTAVREAIQEYQPLVSLHGHIHESRGEARIGRTLALNSGSEYNSGRIHGVVVKLGEDEVLSHQFTIG
ncbi:MAG: metallophosphoesterase family protein [Solirubrobacteraceae bacterium]